ncbi:hypothetical protein Tco_0760748 [Tanacetum coccineum]
MILARTSSELRSIAYDLKASTKMVEECALSRSDKYSVNELSRKISIKAFQINKFKNGMSYVRNQSHNPQDGKVPDGHKFKMAKRLCLWFNDLLRCQDHNVNYQSSSNKFLNTRNQ